MDSVNKCSILERVEDNAGIMNFSAAENIEVTSPCSSRNNGSGVVENNFSEGKLTSQGSVSSTNATARSLDDYALLGHSGTYTKNREIWSSKSSSTEASSPNSRSKTGAVMEFPPDKIRERSFSGKKFTESTPQGQRGKSWIVATKNLEGIRSTSRRKTLIPAWNLICEASILCLCREHTPQVLEYRAKDPLITMEIMAMEFRAFNRSLTVGFKMVRRYIKITHLNTSVMTHLGRLKEGTRIPQRIWILWLNLSLTSNL